MGLKYGNTVLFFTLPILLANCFDFNRQYTGVKLWPYVKSNENGLGVPPKSAHSFEELQTMLEVISTRFSRVFTVTTDTFSNAQYSPTKTYYYESYVVARVAEAAALINQERGNNSLSVIVGISYRNDGKSGGTTSSAEANVALEGVNKANMIFPGTVEGIVFFSSTDDLPWARLTLPLMKFARNMTAGYDIKVGLYQWCSRFEKLSNRYQPRGNVSTQTLEHWRLKREILRSADFFMCQLNMLGAKAHFGVKAAINIFTKDYGRYRSGIMETNDKIAVMAQTGWDTAGNASWQSLENMRDFWEAMNEFATRNKVHIWFDEAMDNPWRTSYYNLGWWRLVRNDLAGQKSGYVEKISVPDEVMLTTTTADSTSGKTNSRDSDSGNENYWIWVSVTVGVTCALVVIIVLAVVLFKFYARLNTLTETLTKQEIYEFKFGSPQSNSQDGGEVCGSALKIPYDQSLEIRKELFEILWDEILGTGQFGVVHKARIKNAKMGEVALKMTKRDCPTTALKGLLSEIKVLSYLGKHPNIVSICGAYTAELEKGTVYMATELCVMGSLKDHLIQCQKSLTNHEGVAFDDMIRWSQQIASGMEYLGEIKGVVHADLATRNVLLGTDGIAKITDFGLSRRLYDYANYMKRQAEPLPWRWMALESLKFLEFSMKSDVWSYGVTLWEIFSLGDQPFPGLSWDADFIDNLENGMRMKAPRFATPEIYRIMLSCWELKPEKRPLFSDLKQKTGKLFIGSPI